MSIKKSVSPNKATNKSALKDEDLLRTESPNALAASEKGAVEPKKLDKSNNLTFYFF